jgi:polysaccharide pyruvyl transferase WcaK-like protein
MGDVAMLQVAVDRLRRQWPDALIQVFTNDPAALARHCREAEPLAHCGRTLWFSDRAVLGRLHQHLPRVASRGLMVLKRSMRRHSPGLLSFILRWRLYLTLTDGTALQNFLTALKLADLYVVSGAATMNDKAKAHARVVLGTIEMALSRGTRVALFSQGIGPMSDDELLAAASRVLPRVTLVATRENRHGPVLLKTLGVPQSKISVTGDDAIEMAYEGRTSLVGEGIGVNLRVARSSDVNPAVIDVVGRVLRKVAKKYNAPLIPLPIALHSTADDPKIIRQLLAGFDTQSDGGQALDTPRQVIAAAGRCRIVVTGAYHAAVFALAQGIPAVCLAANTEYMEKFAGLVDQFGAGCELISVNSSNLSDELLDAIERAWTVAPARRPLLLAATARQMELSRTAYHVIADIMTADLAQTAPLTPSYSSI